LIRHWFGVPSAAIAVLLGISLSACAGSGAQSAAPAAAIPQQAQHSSPNSISPFWPIAVTETFNPTSLDGQGGGNSKLTIVFTSNKYDPFTYAPLTFQDTLPANLIVVGGQAGVLSDTCGGQTIVSANYTMFGIKNGTLQPEGASCSITMSISGHIAGTYDNAIPPGAVTAPDAETSNAANAYVTVLPPHVIKP
jgi:hypothetical protein